MEKGGAVMIVVGIMLIDSLTLGLLLHRHKDDPISVLASLFPLAFASALGVLCVNGYIGL